jgi:hypothetical protein
MSAVWLYQMSANIWKETQYRLQVWEAIPVYWPAKQIKGEQRPAPGDRILCWYAKAGATSPGLCGWGVVLSFDDESNEIAWRPVFPSDLMKMHPLFDTSIAARVDSIRGKVPRGTLWRIERVDADWLMERVSSVSRRA